MVCDECGSLSIKMPDPKNAPCSTIIRCGRCDASRGTLDGLHQLARQAIAICLNSSGADWTERIKRLAVLAPGLDIFGSRFVLVDDAGWQTTDAGRAFLLSL